jgi:hypothetical protein
LRELKPPQVLTDVYRDLRDRRLLLPAIALIVGLIAVPVLLKSSDTPAPPPPAPVASTGPESALTAAVLADDTVSVRNYRKRLDELNSKNPFKPQFVPPPPSGSGGGSSTPATPTSGATAPVESTQGGSSGSAYPTETGTASDPSVTVDETTVDETPNTAGGNGNGNGNGGNGSGSGNQPSSDDVEVVNHLVTRRVDLMIGLQGDPKLRENVKPMTILPDANTPVVAYLGTDEKGKRAAFVVAKDATLAGGTAACVPAPENCLYITLQKGETATLDFGPDGQTFELRLLEIRDHELKAE